MEFYREVYKDSPRWDGSPLGDRTLIVYCEQGFGDIIQVSRFIRDIPVESGRILLACPKELHRLFDNSFHVECFDKTSPILPLHDFHVLSMSLPFQVTPDHSLPPQYLLSPEKEDLSEFKGLNVGIAWESKSNPQKSIPLKFFGKLQNRVGANLFMLQDKIHDPGLIDQNVALYSIKIEDFADTAKLIAAVDVVVSVDTAVLHLAGAMGKLTYGLISTDLTDGRFNRCKPLEVGYQPVWYPTVRILFRESSVSWTDIFRTLTNRLQKD